MNRPETANAWEAFLADATERVKAGSRLEVRGTLTRLSGLVLEAAGIRVPVGSQCLVTMKGCLILYYFYLPSN